jgi:ferric iron reductase protein FhuF
MNGWQALAACLEVVTMRVDAGVETVPLRSLSDPQSLAPLVERFGRSYPDGDRRAVASIWVKYYCRMVLSPLIAFSLRDRSAMLVTPDGDQDAALVMTGPLPYGLLLPSPPAAGQPLELIYGTGLRDHMAPVFDALQLAFRLSPRVSWANAGLVADHILTTLSTDSDLGARAQEDRELLIGARANPWFPTRNPLFEPVRTIDIILDGRPIRHRQQRVCCIRDRIPEMPLCGNCPKLKGAALEAILRGEPASP